MGFGEIPLYHLLAHPFVLLSAILYVYLVANILRRRRAESSLFQTPFFTLVVGQAFWDLSMFSVAFFLVFCRRYLLFPFPPSENSFYPKSIYFLQTVFTNCMYMSSVLYALSRMTAFIWPAKQDTVSVRSGQILLIFQLWSTRNIFLAMVLIGSLACVNVGRLFIGNPSVSLRIIAPGRMKMFQDDSLLQVAALLAPNCHFQQDSYQDLALSVGCCLICFTIYTWAAWRSKSLGTKGDMVGALRSYNFFLQRYQKKFLFCAITTFLPYIPNAIKSYLLIYAGVTDDDILTGYCIEAW